MSVNPENKVWQAEDMLKEHWIKVLNNSGVLKAWIGKQDNDRIIVKRALSPAFSLRAELNRPHFEVDDDSYIGSQQTSKRVESELSSKGFSEWGVQASLAGGAHGLTLGLSGDISRRKELTSTSSHAVEVKKIHCSYNFPRVVLSLDSETLTLSRQCIDALEALRLATETGAGRGIDENELKNFFEKFGGIFDGEVCLGGRLYSTESLTNQTDTQILARKNEMKRALTANFMGPFVGAGAGWSQTKGSENSGTRESSSGYQGISIEAHGGNSLLSWSAQQWAVSVEHYPYWRAIRQDKVVKLIPYLSEKLADFEFEGKKYKATIEKLRAAYDAKKNGANEEEEKVLVIEVGNSFRLLAPYERISSNPARWTFWLSPSRPDMIKEVKVTLHKTFKPHVIEFGEHKPEVCAKMIVTRDGWGVFPIHVEILLMDSWGWRDKNGNEIARGVPLEKDWNLYLDLSKPEGIMSISDSWLVMSHTPGT